MPAPPPAATLAPPTTAFTGRLVLLRTDGELAVFAPGVSTADGVTFKVRTSGAGTFLTLEEVSFACVPG